MVQQVIAILNGVGLILVGLGGLVAYHVFKRRITQLKSSLVDLAQVQERSYEIVNSQGAQIHAPSGRQRRIGEELMGDRSGYQLPRDWPASNAVANKSADRLRDELSRCEASCELALNSLSRLMLRKS